MMERDSECRSAKVFITQIMLYYSLLYTNNFERIIIQ